MKYAHSKRDPLTKILLPKEQWHGLDLHSEGTANLAGEFASCFKCEILGEILGYVHDYGKNLLDFQRRLEGSKRKVDHKTMGALAVYQHYPHPYGLILAYAIYGHHGGLPDHISRGGVPGLHDVLSNNKFKIIDNVPPNFPQLIEHTIPKRSPTANRGMSRSLWIRMLYSALVDADYLDTERFLRPEKAAARQSFMPLEQLSVLYQKKLDELLSSSSDSVMARARRKVLKSCLRKALGPKGFYTLRAPTGSGKTYSSLAFALEHAKHQNMIGNCTKRVIVALPFTSLIEQTVGVYREALSKDNLNTVLEYHSNIVIEPGDENELDPRLLDSENFDAGLIVTTNVQLFESLFASKPSRARKLHRLANSVIILDEAQALPEHLLLPTLAVLRCLVADYGVTVLFCTATQPAFQDSWLDGIQPVEIIEEPGQLYSELKRVNTTFIGRKTNRELAELIISNGNRVLCIVNTRKQAQHLYGLLTKSEQIEKSDVYHLSALMTADDRIKMLKEIKSKAKEDPCYVIATTLVEAGVDIDFPIVMREMTGIEGIAQAAGRCNRERLVEKGTMFLFESADYSSSPNAWYSGRAKLAKFILSRHADPLTPEAVEEYFQRFYFQEKSHLDKHGILRNLNGAADEYSFQFREIAELYQFIKEDTVSVVIPHTEACRELLQQANESQYPASFSRKLQRYAISLYPTELEYLCNKRRLGTIGNAIYYLQDSEGGFEGDITDLYDGRLGLKVYTEEED
ncbi:CRISPR-associated helicase Cas3' [Paenibacillaceae bacterium WGS1546]|uniref:CRISPR-associated helicase Cas3' n=1 Tax=Cohnella sp. WGS1546 TaxID=3366810 RepID=UPI00372D26BE